MAAKKLSQQELRQLMQERAQSKTVARIDSPLARYDEKNKLWCVLCNVQILSEKFWSSHLVEKAHKKKIEELKSKHKQASNQLEVGKSVPENGVGQKRSLDVEKSGERKKIVKSKFENISEFSKKEISIKQSKVSESDSGEKENTAVTDAPDEKVLSSLPTDFFDSDPNINQQTADSTTPTDILPKGFFDDPKLEEKSRKNNAANNKDPLDEQMEIFRKEIAQESILSEVFLEEEIEQQQKEKTIFEIEEQMSNWQKVEHYQKKIEEIHDRRLKEKNKSLSQTETQSYDGVHQLHDDIKKDQNEDDDDTDEDELHDMNFWRSKQVFR